MSVQMLHEAIATGELSAVRAALTERNVNQSINGWTALHSCVFGNQPDIAKYLCEHGANVNSRGDTRENLDEETPLMIAAARNRVAVAQVLLENGADVSLKDANGHDAMYWALQEHDSEMVCLLERYQPSEQKRHREAAVSQEARVLYQETGDEYTSFSNSGICISRDGRFGLMGWYKEDIGHQINVFDIPAGNTIWSVEGSEFFGLADDGDAILMYDYDRKSFYRRERNGTRSPLSMSSEARTALRDHVGPAPEWITFSPSGKYSLERVDRVGLVATDSGKRLASLTNGSFVFSCDEKLLLTAADSKLALYDISPDNEESKGGLWSRIRRSFASHKVVCRWSRSCGLRSAVALDPQSQRGLVKTVEGDWNDRDHKETILVVDMESGETVQQLDIEEGRITQNIGFLANGRVAFAFGYPYHNDVNIDNEKSRGVTMWDLDGIPEAPRVDFRGWTREPYGHSNRHIATSSDANHLLYGAFNVTYVPVSWSHLSPLFEK